MKKFKILSILFCLLLFVCLVPTGCTSVDNSPLFDQDLPWSYGNYDCNETCNYEFSRYLSVDNVDELYVLDGEDKNKGYKLNSSGEITYTLKEGKSVKLSNGEIEETKDPDATLIKMEMTVEYKDDLSHITNAAVRNLYQGKTDTMVSYAVIDRYYLFPLFTYKKATIGAQAAGDSKNYTVIADYTGEFTDKAEAKLIDSRGTFYSGIKNGVYYDSESLSYIIRTMRSVRTSGTTTRTFDLTSPYDDLLVNAKRLSPKGASVSTASTLSKVKLSEDIYGLFDIGEDLLNPDFKLDCFKTTLSLTETKSGPPIDFYFSSFPIKAKTLSTPVAAKKVLVFSSYQNNDKSTNAKYVQELILSGYKNTDLQ